MSQSLWRKKDLNSMHLDAKKTNLNKVLTTFDLTMLGIGAVVGSGIFVMIGEGAATAGPALSLSFIIAAITCLFSALAYAEFASTVPLAGSAYTYSYFTIGEFMAWIIGWNLILEYLLAVSVVAGGWSGYFQNLISGFGVTLPEGLTMAPGTKEGVNSYFDLPAFIIIIVLTAILSFGVQQSKKVNNIMVLIKVGVILLFIVVGVGYVEPANWTPYMPYGVDGVFAATSAAFFAFIGFDAISSAAEETVNPQKSLPRGILFSLLICTVLYIIVTFVMTGLVPYAEFEGVANPISLAIETTGQDWITGIIDLGAILGMTTVMIVMLFGLTRIMFAMSRDGLLPKTLAKTHPKFKTPFNTTWFFGICAALLAAFIPLETLANLTVIGTLAAFIIVSASVIVLRKTHPNLKRGFRCPAVPLIPILSIIACSFLMYNLGFLTWIRFVIWLIIGVIVYFGYSRKHSRLHHKE